MPKSSVGQSCRRFSKLLNKEYDKIISHFPESVASTLGQYLKQKKKKLREIHRKAVNWQWHTGAPPILLV
jgi:hypothetical protein